MSGIIALTFGLFVSLNLGATSCFPRPDVLSKVIPPHGFILVYGAFLDMSLESISGGPKIPMESRILVGDENSSLKAFKPAQPLLEGVNYNVLSYFKSNQSFQVEDQVIVKDRPFPKEIRIDYITRNMEESKGEEFLLTGLVKIHVSVRNAPLKIIVTNEGEPQKVTYAFSGNDGDFVIGSQPPRGVPWHGCPRWDGVYPLHFKKNKTYKLKVQLLEARNTQEFFEATTESNEIELNTSPTIIDYMRFHSFIGLFTSSN